MSKAIIVLLVIFSFLVSCNKSHLNDVTKDLPDEPIIENFGQNDGTGIDSVQTLSLHETPFSVSELYVSQNDGSNWDTTEIDKANFIFTNLKAYFFRCTSDSSKSLI